MQYVKRLLSNLIMPLLCAALLLGQAQPAQAANYNDISGHWARDVIVRWEALGALVDFPAGNFQPDKPITRAEFFSLLVHALGATEMADISRFIDVPEDAWYYEVVAIAAQMRIANGAGETAMKPTENIVRQDAATIVARAMGLPNENENYLYRYNDSANISAYARNFVSAITERDYMRGSYGNFYPRNFLSRAEAVKIVDNLFTHYFRPEVGFDNFVLNGNVLSTRTDSVFNDLTINGDLILGDGVGQGNATLNNCTINGRLLIRGGGSSSIVLNNSRVTGGVTIISPSSTPRVVSTGTTSVPRLTAYSNFILAGTGVHSAYIADDAFYDTTAILEGVMLSTMYAGGVENNVDLREGRITNLHIGGAADNTTCALDRSTLVDYFSTVSPYTNVIGAGRISDAFINAPGATFAMVPDTYTVGANLTSTIAGQLVSGKELTTINNVVRSAGNLAVSPDSDRTGGEDIHISSSQGRSSNTVLVTQTPYSKLPMENVNGRLGYYLGFFIPAPVNSNRNDIQLLTYVRGDGGLITMEGVSLTRKNNVYGLEFHIPVTRTGTQPRGLLYESMFIQWDNQNAENLHFHSGWLDLDAPTSSQEEVLLEQYEEQRFRGYDGTRYTGAEALQRLLASDNPLGLNVQGFANFDETDQEDLAARVFELSADFTSKQMVQDVLNQALVGKAAMYAVNNAVTAAQMRQSLENESFAKELYIDNTVGTLYGLLSNIGKNRVADTMLNGRSKDYANNAAVKNAFDKAVADIRSAENTLLVAINAGRKPVDAQKLIETKANAETLNFFPGEEPYKSCPSDMKLELGQRILDGKPYYSVDKLAQVIEDFLVTLADSGFKPAVTITGIKVLPTAITLLPGQSAEFTVTVTTPTGTLADLSDVQTVSSNEMIATVDKFVINAMSPGTAKITASIIDKSTGKDKTYSATVSVTVKVPVPSTSVTLTPKRVEVEEGSTSNNLIAKMLPANTTDSLTWSTLHPNIASIRGTVGGNSILEGLTPGLTTAIVRTSSNLTDNAQIIVVSKEPGVMVIPDKLTVGLSQSKPLEAIVSPMSIGDKNRGVTWKSADPTIAMVDPYGNVTGVAEGEVKIIATSKYDTTLSGECTVTVDDSIKQLTLSTRKMVMVPTGIEDVTATVTPAMDPDDRIIWKVRAYEPGGLETEIATVAASDTDIYRARVTAREPGKVYVYAYLESDSSVMAECEVEVLNAQLRITFPAAYSVYTGDKVTTAIPTFTPSTITNKTINWEITDNTLADYELNLNRSLTLVGKKPGTTNLTGKPEAVASLVVSSKVTVSKVEITSFIISPALIEMEEGAEAILATSAGDEGRFDIQIKPDNATDKTILWVASGDNVYLEINQGLDTSVNEYGTSTIKALAPTHTRVENDDGTYKWVGNPTTLVVRAGNLSRTVQVIVYPALSSQVNNVKIQSDRWVYEVGDKVGPFTFYLNVIGREPSGEWKTDPKPPNVGVTWKSSHPDIADFNDSNQLIMKKAGTTQITATSTNNSEYDSITIIVAPPAVDSITFEGLDGDEGGFGKTLHMVMGEEKLVTAKVFPTTSQSVDMEWLPWSWEYNLYDDGSNEAGAWSAGAPSYMAGARQGDSPAWTILKIFTLRNNILHAESPGRVQVEVKPESDYGYAANISINSLRAKYDTTKFDAILAANGIVYDSGTNAFYSPNEAPLLTTTIPPNSFAKPLNLDAGLNLLVPNKLEAGSNEFFVWITGAELTTLSITEPSAPNQEVPKGGTFTVTAKTDPNLTIESIVWSHNQTYLNKTSPGNGYDPFTGLCTATFMVDDNADPGSYNISLTVKTKTEYGFRSVTNRPRQVQEGKTKTVVYPVQVVESIIPGSQPLSTPALLANPASQAIPEQADSVTPTTNPNAMPTTLESPVYETLLSVTTSKVLKLRGTATVTLGNSIRLIPVLSPGNYDPTGLTWASAKPDIASVDGNGVVRGVKAGKTTITVSVPGTKLKASCIISVAASLKYPVSGISLNNSLLTLEEGKTATLKATLNPKNASAKGVSWYSSDSSVATVDASGKVAAISAGSATITAITDDGGRTATCTVTVTAKPIRVTGVTMKQTTITMAVGEQFALEYTIAPEDAANQEVRWSSSNARVVSVSNGQITALRKGTATITVVSVDGSKRATCKVTVK